ncbi:MAG: hypothetical protein ABI396_08470, partial [Ktedonobacteraceae bacterium]
ILFLSLFHTRINSSKSIFYKEYSEWLKLYHTEPFYTMGNNTKAGLMRSQTVKKGRQTASSLVG